ncbi:DUF1272 domain-containing protein [Pseudomonas sp. Marseille-Q8238]
MLELRPGCECCDCDLPADSTEALICSFECTFCLACAQALQLCCPNCSGELLRRPIRPPHELVDNPASKVRTHKPGGCMHQ